MPNSGAIARATIVCWPPMSEGSAQIVLTKTLVASWLPFASRISPRFAVCHVVRTDRFSAIFDNSSCRHTCKSVNR